MIEEMSVSRRPVARRFRDQLVELIIRGRDYVEAFGGRAAGGGGVHSVLKRTQGGQLPGRDAPRGKLRTVSFEMHAQMKNFLNVALVPVRNISASVGLEVDQPFRTETS